MSNRVLVLDNYDSFTYNLVQYLGELGAEPIVIRNDVMKPTEVADEIQFDRLVISPGPGTPEAAGFSLDYVRAFGPTVPTLGVCLGHQAIVVAYGGKVDLAPEPKHGKTSEVCHDGTGVFAGLDNPFTATRYHSLAAVELPEELRPCAWSEDAIVQGMHHLDDPVVGVQFHPESIMTKEGKKLLANFLRLSSPKGESAGEAGRGDGS